MLAIKYQPNIFLNSVYVPSIFNKIFSTLKWVCRETCSVFLGTRVQHLFILIYSRVTTKHPREKFWTHKIRTRKILDQWNTHEKKFCIHEGKMTRWHETHETHNGTRYTEFNTLFYFRFCNLVNIFPWYSDVSVYFFISRPS